METIKLIIALVMFLSRKKFVIFMLKDIEPMSVREVIQENDEIRGKFSLRGWDIMKLCLVGYISGLYYLAIMNLIWHNIGASIITFLFGWENARLEFIKQIFKKIDQTSNQNQEENFDKFY